METSVIMSSTDPDGNEINRTYSGINPTATSEEITDFTEELNALSDNTYVGTTRRDITHVDREQGLVAYSLPTAAEDVKGGVMIGAGLSMTGDTLNCTISSGTLSEASTTDKGLMSADDKVKLNGISAGAQVNVIEAILIDDTPQTITNKAVSLNLTDYAKKSDISGVYKYKGTVGSLSGLSSVGNEVGDVYNVSMGGGSDFQGVEIKPGDNVAWNGSGWDALTGIVDLSGLQYTLPTASTSTKGGVVIGSGLSMAGDTVYVTLQGGAGGGSYPIATSLEAGLMSAEDKQHLDSVFQSSADFADAVLTGVGGKFIPSVSSVSDFMTYQDSNIQFFDNRLNRLCTTNAITPYTKHSPTFLNNSVDLSIEYADYKNSLHSSAEGTTDVTLPSDTDRYTYEFDFNKTAEDKGFILMSRYDNDERVYVKQAFRSFLVTNTGQVSLGSEVSLATGSSTMSASCPDAHPSVFDPSKVVFLWQKENQNNNDITYYYRGYWFPNNGTTTASTISSSATTLGTYHYSTSTSITDVQPSRAIVTLLVSLNKTDATKIEVTTESSPPQPLFYTDETTYNSSSQVTSSKTKLWCIHGSYSTTDMLISSAIVRQDTGSSDYTYPMDGFDPVRDKIIGLYSDSTRASWYLITARRGTYPNDSTWIDSCFKVWYFNPRTVAIRRCEKSLSQILPDLVI